MADSIQIPDDGSKYVYLYHPNFPAAKRVPRLNRQKSGPSDELQQLQRDGWSDRRYAVVLYHQEFGSTICKTPEETAVFKSEGWQDTPPKTGEHAHPHELDTYRMVEGKKAEARKQALAAIEQKKEDTRRKANKESRD